VKKTKLRNTVGRHSRPPFISAQIPTPCARRAAAGAQWGRMSLSDLLFSLECLPMSAALACGTLRLSPALAAAAPEK
jgi:hypothetical protein